MKKSKEQNSKLSIEKFQISKINNPQLIIGGKANFADNDDDDRTISDQH